MHHKAYRISLFLILLCTGVGFSQSAGTENTPPGKNIESLVVYPNPVSTGKLYVVTTRNLTKQVEIYNLIGQQILSETLLGKELNISKVKPGIYIIKITENTKSATRKLIVK